MRSTSFGFCMASFRTSQTPAQVRKWRDRVRALTNQGLSSDDAGDRAAKEIFTTNMTHNYAAQPDTIHDILKRYR